VACLPVILVVLSVLICLMQTAAVSRIMSQTHRSPGVGLEALREEILEKERFMSGDFQSFEDLLEALKSSGHSQCTTVWTKDTVAYRCRTCQLNDSRSAAAFAFVFFHTTSTSPTLLPTLLHPRNLDVVSSCFFLCFLSTVSSRS
jgi:E3 ubiquitin-protein ligase UBR1/E3 ubiquitin-protein ligase UBR3